MRVEYNIDKVQDMSYPLFLYELRYVRSPVIPGLIVRSKPIFLNVLAKLRLRPLPLSMSTLVSLTSATTGSRTRRNLPSSEKLVH
jgi:hypothetical protein